MPSLIAALRPEERHQLFDDLNDLNMAELRGFCRGRGIPWMIQVETPADGVRATRDADRKSVVLDRIRAYLATGMVPPPTVFPASVVSDAGLPDHPSASDRLWYGCYDKHHEGLMACLSTLTEGRFRNGAVARIVCREFWTRGEAPALDEYARAWMEADAVGLGIDRGDHPEAAWLTDRARGQGGPDWKERRNQKAERVLAVLAQLPVSPATRTDSS